ncbi:MAG: multidrug effflux MFS transporter [Alphaproteobacteria bacterium]|nr:multidrug effflux MFS transporter [Alphaproteobacteria bacterium]
MPTPTPIHGTPRLIALLGLVSAIGWVGGVMYAPALPELARDLATTPSGAQHSLTVFVAVFGVAPLIIGPLTDRHGRRVVMLSGLVLYGVGSIGAALSQSLEWLLVARIVQAAGAAVPMTVARAVARDVWSFAEVRRPMALIVGFSAMAPALSLATGGFVAAALGWRGVFWTSAALAFLFAGLCALRLPETHPDRNPALYGGWQVFRNYGVLLRSKFFVAIAIAQGFLGGAIFIIMTGAPFVVLGRMGIGPEVFGLLTAWLPGGFFLGNLAAGVITNRLSIARLTALGCLISTIAAGTLFAITFTDALTLAALYICVACYTFGFGMMLPSTTAAAIEVRPETAGTAAALLSSTQQGFSALASLLVSQVESGPGFGMVASFAAMVAAGALAVAAAARWTPRRMG